METKKLKYFCKYLPVEGEIKIGGMTQGTAGGFYDVTEVEIMLNEKGLMKYKPFKLFLCSRDIQVGDEVLSTLNNKRYIVEQVKGFLFRIGSTVYDKDNITHLYKTYFKVIGEISPEAIWVKEGDEFDEDELEPVLFYSKHPDESIYLDDIKRLEHWNKLNPIPTQYISKIEIKCPTCKQFH